MIYNVIYRIQVHELFLGFIYTLGLAEVFRFCNIAYIGLSLWTCKVSLDIKVSHYTEISIILGL